MNSTATAEQCLIEPNPDIIGVGIRISLYILALAGPLVSFIVNSAEFAAAVNSSLGITGFALFLTTVVLTSKGEIDLFHAICIFHLLGLVGISVTPKSAKGTSLTRTWALTILYFVALVGSVSYLIYVFANAPTFGSHPECNSSIRYVLFGINISATNAVIRWIFVASFGLILLGYALSVLIGLIALCCGGDAFYNVIHTPNQDSETQGRQSLWFVVGHEVGCVYVIVMLELIIRRNSVGEGLNDWTFGQILAMMMLMGPLVELGSSLLGESSE